MKTKFYVFNDRQKPMALHVQSIHSEAFFKLPPQSTEMVDLEIPDHTVPFLKVWESGQALLSYIDPATLAQSES